MNSGANDKYWKTCLDSGILQKNILTIKNYC